MDNKAIDLILELGMSLPDNGLLAELASSCVQQIERPSKDNQHRIMTLCLMIMAKFAAQSREGGAMELMEHLRRKHEFEQMVNPDRPKN